jgi:hypothetical protein
MGRAITFVALLASAPAAAEVSDKIATQSQLWLLAVVLAVVFSCGAVYRPLFGLIGLVAAAALAYAYANHTTLADPYIGTAALAEQGNAYWWATYGSSAVMLLAIAGGTYVGLRKRTLLGEVRADAV